MAIPQLLENSLNLPVIVAPMFLTSGPALVTAACRNGLVGSFPALNQRTSEGFENWLVEIKQELEKVTKETPSRRIAPYAVNLIVHKSNQRLGQDLEICVKHQVPIIITSLGAVPDLVDRVHDYGGIVLHDVTNMRHARKAISAGVDGLILVCAGGGGHASAISPFAMIAQIRREFDGAIILAGTLSTGRDVAAARMMGADLAYMGTRFLATRESLVSDDYKQMVVDSCAEDIVYTPKLSGVSANFLGKSLEAAGLDLSALSKPDFDAHKELCATDRKVWKTIWSAGQGCTAIDDIPAAKTLIDRLKNDYEAALQEAGSMLAKTGGKLK